MSNGIASSLAARLSHSGMAKTSIIAAFRRSVDNATSFLDELYASDDADEELISGALAQETGLQFDKIRSDVGVIAPTASAFAWLIQIRHALVVTANRQILIYIAPTMRDLPVLKTQLAQSRDMALRLRITTRSHLSEFLRTRHENALLANALNMVEVANHGFSARIVLTGRQGIFVGLLGAAIFSGIAMAPSSLSCILHMIFSLFFVACILLRILAIRAADTRVTTVRPAAAMRKLPVYSVMIALYREVDVVPQLIRSMKQLNWPLSRLEVFFLCEADDTATLTAFESQRLPHGFKVVPVPCLGPRTKPKALNYGLQLVNGEFVVVYDAEDRPHPDQLAEAWQRFTAAEGDLACLQAPLVIANAHEGWIARLFAFEYAANFFGLLPWLASKGLVLPLGGSSNHFRRECLIAVGGWDPYNVTEDAELGTRLVRSGFRVEMLSLPTIEDAPTEAAVWLRQRTRWLKGWTQTWLVEMRHPVRLFRDLGPRRFLVYHGLAAGLIVSSLLYPFMLVFMAYSVFSLILYDTSITNRSILLFDFMNITMGFLSFHALGRSSTAGKRIKGPILRCVPLYWLMMSMAAWRAVKQLCTKPFLWEKTPHRPFARENPDPSR
ncbi:glycosyltransferase [Phyllobacterium endophyticum]|uniref:glycosyltransferase n=1 Tax=Phyllobacterium endophyticum TaxID=1149773 RepID=UPI0011CC1511|nr:glycosyltransferase [Phyllobacterium endophyticum]TXR48380.1 glycosyltransferase [Phyllobacterium endophyticum]